MDFGTPQTVTQIKYAPRSGNGALMLLGRFQVSNDPTFKTGVVTLATITTIPPSGVLTQQTVSSPGAFRYIRFIGVPGSYSQVAELEFYGQPATSDQTKPSKPGKPVAGTRTINSIAISWAASTDNVGVDHYDIFRNGKKIGSSPTNSFTDTGLTPNSAYTYQVQAVDAAGNTSTVSDLLLTSTLKDTTAPSKPTNVRKSSSTRTSILVAWNASTDNVGVAYYEIWRDGKKVGTTTSLSFNVTGLKANTNYKFKIRAFDAAGNASPYSDEVTLKTSA